MKREEGDYTLEYQVKMKFPQNRMSLNVFD